MSSSPMSGTGLATATGEVWRGHRNQHMLATARAHYWRVVISALLFLAAIALVLIAGDFPVWRAVLLFVNFGLLLLGQGLFIRRTHTPADVDRSIVLINVGAQIHIVVGVVLTGGVHSPFFVSLPASAFLPLLFFGPHYISRALICLLILLVVGVAAMPVEWTGSGLPHPYHAVISVLSLTWTVSVAQAMTRRVYDASRAGLGAIDQMREERIADAATQLRRLQSVGAKVAHELKNPLAAIKGLVQLVTRSVEGDRAKERLEVVQSEIARMETILHEYLSFSRPLEDLKPQPIDVADVAVDVLAVLAGRAEHGRVEIVEKTAATPIQADPRRLKEALINIVANAIEATPPGGQIELVTRPGDSGTGAIIQVRDTGRGIKTEDMQRVGTSFFTTRAGGTGLGVVLAKNVVCQHGGTMRFASEVGVGTTVTVELPARASARGTRGQDTAGG
jgi:signal transduction histidine kinase